MPKFDKLHLVQHRAVDMFELVGDVERYPQFVPMCEKLTVRSRRVVGERERIIADMKIGYKFISETFTSQVTLNPQALEVGVEYIDGPFRYLNNNWKFVDTGKRTSEIHFAIDYEFKSRALALVMGAVFEKVFAKFTTAFEQRADEIYGARN